MVNPLPASTTILLSAGVGCPIAAAYSIGAGLVVIDSIAKELVYKDHKTPSSHGYTGFKVLVNFMKFAQAHVSKTNCSLVLMYCWHELLRPSSAVLHAATSLSLSCTLSSFHLGTSAKCCCWRVSFSVRSTSVCAHGWKAVRVHVYRRFGYEGHRGNMPMCTNSQVHLEHYLL